MSETTKNWPDMGRYMNKTIGMTVVALILIGNVVSCRYLMPERYVDYNKGRVPVNLPRDLKNSDKDINIDRARATIITVTADGRMYLGTDHSPIDGRDLGAKIRPLLESQVEEDRIVYLAVDAAADYGYVITACNETRKIESARVGLLVTRVNDDWPSRLLVELPPAPNPQEDVSKLRPNPLTLITTIASDLKVKLNQDPMGSVGDLSPLSQKLQQIFQSRKEQHAYRPGYETAVDVPESERIEKTVTINGPKQLKYGDVAKVIDAVKSAGASPIVLQLDEIRTLTIRQSSY